MSLRLYAAERGAGPPVIILHGLFGSSGNWGSIAGRLSPSRRVLTLDLRNHGRSPWADDMSYAAMADDVAAFIEERALGRAALVGHSMGGKTAMVLALRHGEMVERLAVVDIAPVAHPPTLLPYVQAMRRLDLDRVMRRAEADRLLRDAIPNAAERTFLLQNLAPADSGLRWRLNLAAIERAMAEISAFPDFPDDAAYPGPTLFITGGSSDYVRPEHQASARRLFPHAEFAEVAEAGHLVHAERPEGFLATLEPFLGSA